VLSSMVFIELFNALTLISRFLCGALACRMVVAFELYGLRVASWEN